MITGTSASISAAIARQQRMGADIAQLQLGIDTGKRLTQGSDDPLAAARISDIARAQADASVWKSNLDAASATADQVDSALGTLSTIFDRVKEIMVAAGSTTYSDSDRAIAVTELQGLQDQLGAVKDLTDARGEPLFPTGGPALSYPIGPGTTITPSGSLNEVFRGADLGNGTLGLGEVIANAMAAVSTEDPAARTAAVQDSLGQVDQAVDHVASTRGVLGLRAAQIDAARDKLSDTSLNLTAQRSVLESTDMTQALSLIKEKMTTLEAAQAVFSKINQGGLFSMLS